MPEAGNLQKDEIKEILSYGSKHRGLLHKVLVPDNRRKCAVLTVDRLFEVSRCNAEQEEFL